jgi:metal-dependent amidase/aminoacylase/carboxypeptidase family protein
MKGGAKVLVNDEEMATTVRPALQALLGEKAVLTKVPKVMGSEDFPHLVIENETYRYLFLLVGTAKPEHVQKAQAEGKFVPYSNHNPDYQVDLDAIALGTKIGVTSLMAFLA